MKWLLATVVPFMFALAASPGKAALMDDEEYVKVEIKGTLNVSYRGGPAVEVGGKVFHLYLGKVVGGPPTEKQLKDWDGKTIIVEGRLKFGLLQSDGPPTVLVTRIAAYKKSEPGKD